jgi:predicted RNA-binding protein with PUA-like domain
VAYWLLKSEPDTFSYQDLVRVKREGWDGVRNYTARIFLRHMRKGDQAIFYHSNAKPPGAAGICKIVKEAEPDPTQFDPSSKYYDPSSKPEDPRWDWVTVAPVKKIGFVSLDELRAMPEMANSRLLARGNRLSVIPLTDDEFAAIVAAGTKKKRSRPALPGQRFRVSASGSS